MAYPDPYKPSDVKREGNSYSGMNVTGDNISINGQTPGGGFMVSGGLAARAMAQQSSASQRSPVGMTVEQAQQQGLIGERVGYNPAYDQRINGGRVYNPAYDQEINESGMGGGLAARAMAQAAMQQREPYNPNVGSSSQWMGDLRDPRNLALRNASVGSTIFRNKGEEMMANKARQARVAGVQAAIGGQMHDAQQAETERYQSNNTLAGHLGTEQMRQDGESQRSLAQMALEQQKARTAAAQWGVENRGRSLVQAMQEQIATEQDPSKRKSLVQHMRDIEGRESTMNAPSGYRYKADGSGLEAIPGGPVDVRNGTAAAQQGKDAQDVLSILNQARPLVSASTGSYVGAGVDKAAQAIGLSTPGAEAIAQLKALEGSLVSKMPKMSGPQSDKDVLLYRQMAGQIGDATVPAQQRLAAMAAVEELHRKYAPAGVPAAQTQQSGQPRQARPSIDSFWGAQ